MTITDSKGRGLRGGLIGRAAPNQSPTGTPGWRHEAGRLCLYKMASLQRDREWNALLSLAFCWLALYNLQSDYKQSKEFSR